jgi:hypothetical protein
MALMYLVAGGLWRELVIRRIAQSVRALAVLGIEDRVGRLALRKDRAVLPVGSECSAGTDVGPIPTLVS